MKLLAYLIISIGLVVGLIATSTAYAPKLSLADEELIGLTLSAPAGRTEITDGSDITAEPLVEAKAEVTPETLELLRTNDVERIRTAEFAWSRWAERYVFLLGVALMGVGTALVKASQRSTSAAPRADGAGSPDAAFETVAATLPTLEQELSTLDSDHARLERIIKVLGGLQRDQIPTIVLARETLQRRLGLTGYAEFMDRFSALERAINRAWSAAADAHLPEAHRSIRTAIPLIEATREKLSRTHSIDRSNRHERPIQP